MIQELFSLMMVLEIIFKLAEFHIELFLLYCNHQGCHASGKSQGNLNFFKVRDLANCQGNLESLVNVG